LVRQAKRSRGGEGEAKALVGAFETERERKIIFFRSEFEASRGRFEITQGLFFSVALETKILTVETDRDWEERQGARKKRPTERGFF